MKVGPYSLRVQFDDQTERVIDFTPLLHGELFVEAGGRHHEPHFHAYYQEHIGVFSIDPIALVTGDLPKRQQRLVEAWAELHAEELMADWALLQSGRKPRAIAPLA